LWLHKKKGSTTDFFSPLSFVAVFGSGIWIRKGEKSESGINIPVPQHCRELSHSLLQEFARVHDELGQFADLQRHLAAGLRLPAQLAALPFSALVNPFPQAMCLL
jgi:hypothetical protein